jgi:hypothetical protein
MGLDGGDGLQGRPVEFPEVEPWPRPVDGAKLIDDIATAIRGHVVMSNEARDTCALWVIHTYLIRHFTVSPKLSIKSPVKGCGKSTLLDALKHLAHRAVTTESIRPAALFRMIETYHPTLCIDEVDTFVGKDLELQGMLNASHRYDGHVTRTVGETFEPRQFTVYAPIALSGIGRLTATLADRSLPIVLHRKLPKETIMQLRVGRTGHLEELRRRIVRWIADHGEQVGAREPALPDFLVNRAADNWFPLFAIAEVAGGDWPQRVRTAAAKLSIDNDTSTRLELLLGDIRDIAAKPKAEQMSSALLVERLKEIEGRPWAEYGKTGKPITANQLARLLREVGIVSEQIRVQQWDELVGKHVESQLRGYKLAQFEDAFARYLPPDTERKNAPEGNRNRQSVTNPIDSGTSAISQPSQTKPSVTVAKCEKSNNDGVCDTVTVANPENGENAESDGRGGAHALDATPNPGEPCGERTCAQCGRPGATLPAAWGDSGDFYLHPGDCQERWINDRMAERGVWAP